MANNHFAVPAVERELDHLFEGPTPDADTLRFGHIGHPVSLVAAAIAVRLPRRAQVVFHDVLRHIGRNLCDRPCARVAVS